MAEKWITKTKKVNGETVETKYRVDADFKPAEIGEISMEFIENWCVANNQIEWLLDEVNISEYAVIRDKGKPTEHKEIVKCDNYPFVNLRKDFAEKFFSNIFKGNKAETWKDMLNRKYGKK